MKNKILIIIIVFLQSSVLFAENFTIEAKNITVDKDKEISIFNDEVIITTENNEIIKSDYAEYSKKKNLIVLKNNIIATDNQNNRTKSNFIEFDTLKKTLFSKGFTEIITTDDYIIKGNDILLDAKKNIIKSNKKTLISDQKDTNIYLNNFEYLKNKSVFKSIGYVKVEDKTNNVYEFSQIYIDTKKREVIGTDNKTYLNNQDFKINKENKPRIFSNNIKIQNNLTTFDKSIFTLCNYRKDDKCPPWSIQASKMLHDNLKKSIYYDNAIIKIYNLPIFYFPKLSHPDPSVDRRSGFLPPTFSDGKNLGPDITIPYFFDLGKDKNFTLTNRLFAEQNPLIIGEYHQAFKNTNLLLDFGYTKGLNKNKKIKNSGESNHFFSKIIKNFKGENGSENIFGLTTQHISNDKYLKLYKLKSDLITSDIISLENSINFTHDSDDVYLGINASVFETLNENYNDKYEYIYPEIIFEKNLFRNDSFGSLDLETNYKVNTYDTNKYSNFLINDFNWEFKNVKFDSGINNKLFGNFKNINYRTKNIDLYKEDTTNEIYGAFGYFADVNFVKKVNEKDFLFKPKLLLRYAPGSMRDEIEGEKLNPEKAFSLDRLNNNKNFETGLSGTIGFDYETKNNDKELNFSVAQIINEKENKKMASDTSLDEKLSDLVGSVEYKFNDKFSYNYNFSVDQNYNDINYNEIGTNLDLGQLNLKFNYLEERKHIGNKNYLKSKIEYNNNERNSILFETKRNLVTDSSEFYDLSYNYYNDCLKAGLVYRREFYNDSELDPEHSLMFRITLIPFGNIDSPTIDQ